MRHVCFLAIILALALSGCKVNGPIAPGGNNMPPQWASTVGAVSVVAGESAITVYWGEAIDFQDPPVQYLIYKDSDDNPFDQAPVVRDSNEPYTFKNLADGTEYWFGVRCRDSAKPPHVDDNDKAVSGRTVELRGWARTWGGVNDDMGSGVAVDSFGNSIVAGQFSGTVDFDPGSGVDMHTSEKTVGNFLCMFDLSGGFKWARTWGWHGTLYGYDVAVDGSGNPIATGSIEGTGNLDPSPGSQSYHANGDWDDGYIVKFLANGTWQWSVAFGGNSFDMINGVVADSAGNIYVNGGTASASVDYDPGPGDATLANLGSYDGYISKFDSNGKFQWVDKIGGTDHDNSWDCTLDQGGNVVVGGHFNGTVDFDPGAGTHFVNADSGSDAYVLNLTPAGAFNWVSTFDGPGTSETEKVKVGPDGMINASGYFDSSVDFDPGAGITTKSANGGYDTYIDWLLPSGGW